MDLRDVKKVDSGSEDVTKSLPDEILAKILCFLPTKRAASTSILSKRWRDLFPLMIRLFSSQHHFYLNDLDLVYPVAESKKERQDVHRSFRDFVRRTLSCSDTIKKLSLRCQDGLICFDLTNQWIRIALERGLVALDLRLKPNVGPRMASHYLHASHRLPSRVFANKTLVKLALGVDLGDRRTVYPQVSLPVLKSLYLHGLWFRVEGLCSRMLPGCPRLKELSLRYFCGNFITDLHERQLVISISHKTLKSLSVHCNNSLDFPCTATFKTPSLVYFDYSGVAPFRFSADNSLSSLLEAKLDVELKRRYSAPTRAPTDLSMIIECICNITTLSLSSTSVEAMYSTCTEVPSFVNLVKLSFESNTKEGWKLLPLLLNKSPKLRTLVLKGLHCVENEQVCIDRSKVKVFEVYGFRGSRGRKVTQRDCSLGATVPSSVEGGT